MPKSPKTLEQLKAEEEQAMARAAEARAAAREIRLRAQQRRADAQHAYDEQLIADWTEQHAQLEKDIAAARERLREALLADPVWSAYHDLILAGHRLTTRTLEVHGAMGRVRGPMEGTPQVPHLYPPTFEELARMVEDAATGQGRAEAQAREQAREDVGQVAADQEAEA